MRLVLAVALSLATPLGAQSVAAAGQAAAEPGRFGFALECVAGCSFVPAAMDPAFFRFEGEPRVSAVAPRSAAWRAGLRVGDAIVYVNADPITAIDAGKTLASDSVETLNLQVRRPTGQVRDVRLYAASECKDVRSVAVTNPTGEDLDIWLTAPQGGDKQRYLGRVSSGRNELTIPLPDSAYRAVARYFTWRFASRRQGNTAANQSRQQIPDFRVVCRER